MTTLHSLAADASSAPDAILDILRVDAGAARVRDTKSNRLPVQVALQARAPVGIVRALLDATGIDAGACDEHLGDTLLAIACKGALPPLPEVIELLLDLAPASASIPDAATARTPLHDVLQRYVIPSRSLSHERISPAISEGYCSSLRTSAQNDSDSDDDDDDKKAERKSKKMKAWNAAWTAASVAGVASTNGLAIGDAVAARDSTELPNATVTTDKISAACATAKLMRTRAADEQLRVVELFLKVNKTAAEAVDADGCLPIHYAAASLGPASTVAALLTAYEAGVRVIDNAGQSPLHHACKSGRADSAAALLLLDASRDMAAIADKKGRYPLHLAAQTPGTQHELIARLLTAHPQAARLSTPEHGNFAFTDALASKASMAVLNALLDEYPDVSSKTDLIGCEPLFDAIRNGAPPAIIERLISLNRAAVKSINKDGRNVLHIAARQAAPRCVIDALIAAGADAHALCGSGWTPLHYAIYANLYPHQRCDVSVVRALLDAAPETALVRATKMSPLGKGVTPLSMAVQRYVDPAVFTELLRFPDAIDIEYEECSPLSALLSIGEAPFGAVAALVAARPSIRLIRDKSGRLPVEIAILSRASVDVVRLLLDAAVADEHARFSLPGSSLLMRACNCDELPSPELIELLLEYEKSAAAGVDPKTKRLPLHAVLLRYKLSSKSEHAELVLNRAEAIRDGYTLPSDSDDDDDGSHLREAWDAAWRVAGGSNGDTTNKKIIGAADSKLTKVSKGAALAAAKLMRTRAADEQLRVVELFLKVNKTAAEAVDADGCLPIHYAAASLGPASTVAALLTAYEAGVRVIDNAGQSPLHHACKSGRADSAAALLLLDASRDMAAIADKKGRYPLHLAAQTPGTQHELIARLLTAHPQAARLSTPEHGNFAFTDALASKASMAVLNALLDEYPDVSSKTDLIGCEPLFDAIRNGAPPAIIERLISLNRAAVKSINKDGRNVLHIAARQAAPRCVIDALIAAGADAQSVCNKYGFTPLHYAVYVSSANVRCDASVVRALLDAAPQAALVHAHAGDDEIVDRLPLSLALSHYVEPAVLAELLRFPDAVDVVDLNGYLPLTALLSKGDAPLGAVAALVAARPRIARECDPDFKRSPAHWAASFKANVAVMEFLLSEFPESGNLVDSNKFERPIDIAIRKSAPAAVVALLASRFPTAVRDADERGGETVLVRYLRAARSNADFTATRAILAAHESAITVADENGRVPLRIAMDVGASVAILRLLLSKYQAAVAVPDIKGVSPLLSTFGKGANSAEGLGVAELLRAFPSVTRVAGKDGALPLHVAAASRRSAEVVKALVAVDASAAREFSLKKLLPLHCFVEHFVFLENAEVVCDALVNAYPDACAVRGPSGHLPVRTALSRDAPFTVIKRLLGDSHTGVSLASQPDADGLYLLHVAIGHRAPPDVISLILDAAPEAASVRFHNPFDSYKFPLKLHGVSRLLPLGAFVATLDGKSTASSVKVVEAAVSTAVALLVAHPPAVREGSGALKHLLALYEDTFPASAVLTYLELDRPDDETSSGSESEGFDASSNCSSPASNLSTPLTEARAVSVSGGIHQTDAQSRSIALWRTALRARHPRGFSWSTFFNWRNCVEVAPALNELLLRICPDIQSIRALAHASPSGVRLVDAAPRVVRTLFESRLHLFGRFELTDQPLHESSTSVVWLATDLFAEGVAVSPPPSSGGRRSLSSSSGGGFLSAAGGRISSGGGRSATAAAANRPRVALKFMRNRDQWAREILMRQAIEASSALPTIALAEFITPVLPVLDSFSCDGDGAKLAALRSYDLSEHPHVLVLPAMGASLATITLSERLAEDIGEVRTIVTQIAGALAVLHSRGVVHGDVKPFNILRSLYGGASAGGFGSVAASPTVAASARAQTYYLIDLDGAACAGDAGGVKLSTAYAPPELVRGVIGGIEAGAAVPANAAQDMWSFGATIYALLAGRTFVHTSFSDEATDGGLRDIASWDESSASARDALSAIEHAPARNLVSRLLSRDPRARPTAAEVLRDRFVASGSPLRLAGEEPLYDVMLSYRWGEVESETVAGLYARLTAAGARVWLDRERLRSGVVLRRAFSAGLVQSRLFVPVISRSVLEGGDGRSGFVNLHAGAPCDNVLLESRLAVECQELGLLASDFGIVPVLLGPLPKLPDERLPHTSVATVEAELTTVLSALNLGTPLVKPERTTVAAVHAAIVAHLGAPHISLPVTSTALDAAAADIVRVLTDHHDWKPCAPAPERPDVTQMRAPGHSNSGAIMTESTTDAGSGGPSRFELLAEVALLRAELTRLRTTANS